MELTPQQQQRRIDRIREIHGFKKPAPKTPQQLRKEQNQRTAAYIARGFD